jgi:3-deoxy-D-manno-octulosonate 8-phosphate phosphatase KdsC-like HAD superfamily phosphatase
MARMWPVDGVIGEDGGFFFRRDGHDLERMFWHPDSERDAVDARLKEIVRAVFSKAPGARLAQDQPFRLTSVAFAKPDDAALRSKILAALKDAGADATINNLWILGWLGGYDKLSMARRALSQAYGLNIDADRDAILYSGDSTNDAPMFHFFRHTVGVSTVRDYLPEIPTPPAWITQGPGGSGFVEMAEAVLQSLAHKAGAQ